MTDPKQQSSKQKAGGRSVAAQKKMRALKLTPSAKYLYDVVRNLLRELVPILDNQAHLSGELYPSVVQGMISLFESYLLTMAQAAKEGLGLTGVKAFDDVQNLSIVANAFYLAGTIWHISLCRVSVLKWVVSAARQRQCHFYCLTFFLMCASCVLTVWLCLCRRSVPTCDS